MSSTHPAMPPSSGNLYGEDVWAERFGQEQNQLAGTSKAEVCEQIIRKVSSGENLDEVFVTAVLDKYADLPPEVIDALITDGSDEVQRRLGTRRDCSPAQFERLAMDVLHGLVHSYYMSTTVFSSYRIPTWLLWVAFELAYPDGDPQRSPVLGDYEEFTSNLFYNINLPLQVRAAHTDMDNWNQPYHQGAYWLGADGNLLQPHQEMMESLSIWPDLAGLPLELRISILASQPVEDPAWGRQGVPAEWETQVDALLSTI